MRYSYVGSNEGEFTVITNACVEVFVQLAYVDEPLEYFFRTKASHGFVVVAKGSLPHPRAICHGRELRHDGFQLFGHSVLHVVFSPGTVVHEALWRDKHLADWWVDDGRDWVRVFAQCDNTRNAR